MKIELEPLEIWHLAELEKHSFIETPNEKDCLVKNYDAYKKGKTVCVLFNGKPILAGGVMNLWHSVGEAWIVIAPEAAESGYRTAKSVREYFDLIILAGCFRRVQCAVRSDFDVGIKFAKFLKFEEEGLMKKYDQDGFDYIRFARIEL